MPSLNISAALKRKRVSEMGEDGASPAVKRVRDDMQIPCLRCAKRIHEWADDYECRVDNTCTVRCDRCRDLHRSCEPVPTHLRASVLDILEKKQTSATIEAKRELEREVKAFRTVAEAAVAKVKKENDQKEKELQRELEHQRQQERSMERHESPQRSPPRKTQEELLHLILMEQRYAVEALDRQADAMDRLVDVLTAFLPEEKKEKLVGATQPSANGHTEAEKSTPSSLSEPPEETKDPLLSDL